MRLTRCPACQTVFRLRPEQLHARGGEVRCGHCFHPFNALENMLERAADAPPPAAPEPPPRPPLPDPLLDFDIPEVAPAHPIRVPAADDDWLAPTSPLIDDTDAGLGPASVPTMARGIAGGHASGARFDTADEPARAPPRSFPEVLRSGRRAPRPTDRFAPGGPFAAADGFDDEPPTQIPAPPAPAQTPTLAPTDDDQRASSAAEPDLDRLDATYGRPPRVIHPALRALSALALLALAALLAVQAVYLYRMEIARALPGLRALLSEACARAGCTVPYPRDAELIAIEASDLQAEPGRPGYYLLQATLNNRADYPQQWPHLELTLTDAGDNPLSRRVLPPSDWLPAAPPGEAFPPRNVVELRIPFAAPGVAPTGYRIYAFYP